MPLGISGSKIRKFKMKKLILYSLLGCLLPGQAWAGDIVIPLIVPYFLTRFVIIPFILIEAGILFWQLHKDGITKTKALVTAIWARFYSIVMGIPVLFVVLCVLQFVILFPLARFICKATGGCAYEDFIIYHVLSLGVDASTGYDYFIFIYQGVFYYILLVLAEYGIFQRELPGIDKKRLLNLSLIINSLTYLIFATTVYIWINY